MQDDFFPCVASNLDWGRKKRSDFPFISKKNKIMQMLMPYGVLWFYQLRWKHKLWLLFRIRWHSTSQQLDLYVAAIYNNTHCRNLLSFSLWFITFCCCCFWIYEAVYLNQLWYAYGNWKMNVFIHFAIWKLCGNEWIRSSGNRHICIINLCDAIYVSFVWNFPDWNLKGDKRKLFQKFHFLIKIRWNLVGRQ